VHRSVILHGGCRISRGLVEGIAGRLLIIDVRNQGESSYTTQQDYFHSFHALACTFACDSCIAPPACAEFSASIFARLVLPNEEA
jgi:hypothetical protein